MQTEIVTITPDMAKSMIGQNINNRNLNQIRARGYAAEMKAGRWRMTGEAIKFDAEGRLLDGQHRLMGVILSGVPADFLVLTGMERGTQEFMDSGRARSLSDVFVLRGEKYASTLATVCRLYEHHMTTGLRGSVTNNPNMTRGRLIEVFEENADEFRRAAAMGKRVNDLSPLPTSTAAIAYLLMARIDCDDADFFFERIRDGQMLSEGDPIYALRRWLDAQTSKGLKLAEAGARVTSLAVTFKAWNAYREGREVGHLAWRAGGATPERFPVLV